MAEKTPCIVCKTPTHGKTCSYVCSRKWTSYMYSTPMPPIERQSRWESLEGKESVNDSGDYRPPVRKPRTRR